LPKLVFYQKETDAFPQSIRRITDHEVAHKIQLYKKGETNHNQNLWNLLCKIHKYCMKKGYCKLGKPLEKEGSSFQKK
jgi:translation initiation factor 2 alpha subunit (eIF-2alpha)